jgi:hypothetical protein
VGPLYQPRIIVDEYGEAGGMKIGRGNRRTRRKPSPMPHTRPDEGSNPGHLGGKLWTTRLSYGKASKPRLLCVASCLCCLHIKIEESLSHKQMFFIYQFTACFGQDTPSQVIFEDIHKL